MLGNGVILMAYQINTPYNTIDSIYSGMEYILSMIILMHMMAHSIVSSRACVL